MSNRVSSGPKKATWRMDARMRLRLQNGTVALIVFLMLLGFKPVLQGIIQTRDFQTCQSNVQKIAKAVSTYSADYDESLPVAGEWLDAISGFMEATSGTGFTKAKYLHCPKDTSADSVSYVFNSLFSGLSTISKERDEEAKKRRDGIRRFDRAPLIFERFGVKRNTHERIEDWDSFAKKISMEHTISGAKTSSYISANKVAGKINLEQLEQLSGKRF